RPSAIYDTTSALVPLSQATATAGAAQPARGSNQGARRSASDCRSCGATAMQCRVNLHDPALPGDGGHHGECCRGGCADMAAGKIGASLPCAAVGMAVDGAQATT